MGTPPQPPPPPQAGYGAPQQQGNPGIAIAGFVCALIGLLVSWVGWTIVLCVVGLILSIMGRRQAIERGAPTGLATAGIVMGIIGTVIAVIIIVFVIILVSEGEDVLDDLTITTSTFGQAVIALKLFRGRVIPPLKRLRS